jgi:hypothetical protein
MDVGTVMTTAAVTGGVNLVIGGVVGGLMKRWVDRRDSEVDALQTEVRTLRDNRIAGLEGMIDAHATADQAQHAAIQASFKEHEKDDDERHRQSTASRKEIHQQLSNIERDYVRADLCREQHAALIESQQEFRAAVIDLARVQEQTASVANFASEINKRQIALSSDLARMQGALSKTGAPPP